MRGWSAARRVGQVRKKALAGRTDDILQQRVERRPEEGGVERYPDRRNDDLRLDPCRAIGQPDGSNAPCFFSVPRLAMIMLCSGVWPYK
jgi:hypothetical protein